MSQGSLGLSAIPHFAQSTWPALIRPVTKWHLFSTDPPSWYKAFFRLFHCLCDALNGFFLQRTCATKELKSPLESLEFGAPVTCSLYLALLLSCAFFSLPVQQNQLTPQLQYRSGIIMVIAVWSGKLISLWLILLQMVPAITFST